MQQTSKQSRLKKMEKVAKAQDIKENLCVVSLGPVVAGPALTKDKVVWTVDLAHRSL